MSTIEKSRLHLDHYLITLTAKQVEALKHIADIVNPYARPSAFMWTRMSHVDPTDEGLVVHLNDPPKTCGMRKPQPAYGWKADDGRFVPSFPTCFYCHQPVIGVESSEESAD